MDQCTPRRQRGGTTGRTTGRTVARAAASRGSPADATAYGALDLGTNNCRLLIAQAAPPDNGGGHGFRVVDAFSRIVRLGEGLAASGRLSDDAVDRTVRALRVCASKVRRHRSIRVRSVATEACRRAVNCADFLDRARRETGLALEIITTREEARLALAGCMPLLDGPEPYALVFDIGGGSTELVWLRRSSDGGDGADGAGDIVASLSLPVGVVNFAEKYGGDRFGPAVYGAMVEEIDGLLRPFEAAAAIGARIADDEVQMLGTSGTVTTLASVHLGLSRYDRSAVDGCYLGLDEVAAVSGRLAAMGFAERAAVPCIGRSRADLVVAGAAILDAICRRWPVRRLRVADRGLREGILYGLMAEDRARGDASPPVAAD